MNDEAARGLHPDLLDDFYSECDEHLSAIRQQLGAIEGQSSDSLTPRAPHFRSLLNHFHSFKGISALAGVTSAEQLAHAAEDYLRQLSQQNAPVCSPGLNALMAATKRLEQTVKAHKEKQTLPEVRPELEKLISLISAVQEGPGGEPTETLPPPLAAALATQVHVARREGLSVWRCIFTPSKELDSRGVNITSVRTRLTSLGRILEATPKVIPGKGVLFQFIVGLREIPSNLADWELDGVRFEPTPEPSAASAPGDSSKPPEWHSPFVSPSRLIRVNIDKLDELMRVMEDLVIQRANLEEQVATLAREHGKAVADPLREVCRRLSHSIRDLREAIMDVRLVSMAHLFERMPFVVRDLASDTKKQVRVELTGQETEIDKFIIEQLKAPLLHLVRNAVTHGVEAPEERISQQKSPDAKILLSATTDGDFVIITVQDDGRGIDLDQVIRRSEAVGVNVSNNISSEELLTLLCQPGFSTRDTADRAAGRGVGMMIALDAVRELGGSMSLATQKGVGTTFTLRLPLTLAITDVFVVSSADTLYAVPQNAIAEVMELEGHARQQIGRTEVLHYRNGLLPLVRLSEFFKLPTSHQRQHVLVIETERGLTGLVVDRVVGRRVVVFKALNEPFARARGIAATTELGDGLPVLILDPSVLTRGAARPISNTNQSAASGKGQRS